MCPAEGTGPSPDRTKMETGQKHYRETSSLGKRLQNTPADKRLFRKKCDVNMRTQANTHQVWGLWAGEETEPTLCLKRPIHLTEANTTNH